MRSMPAPFVGTCAQVCTASFSLAAVLTLSVLIPNPAPAAPLTSVVTYRFNDTLSADEPDALPLVPYDSFRLNRFETATVYGQPRRVYHYDGTPEVQAGLSLLDTRGIADDSYTVEIVVQMLERAGSYRRLLETQGRQSDEGLYVDSSDRLSIYPVGSGTMPFVTGQFHYVAVTFDGAIAHAYLDGAPQFSTEAPMMSLDHPANPYRAMNFFLDNEGELGDEYSDGRVALIRLTAGVLPPSEVAARAADPLAIPEPATWILAMIGAAGAIALHRVIHRKARPV